MIIPQQLSPVLESAYSDNSASDYQPHITEPTSPFFTTSSACSGQGLFPLQLNLQKQSQSHFSSVPQQKEVQPFSQPRGMTDTIPLSCRSNPPFSQLERATSSQVLFGNPAPDKTEARQAVTLSQGKEDKEHMLDFMFNQPFVQEASYLRTAKDKIYLTESSTPQTVPNPQNRQGEDEEGCQRWLQAPRTLTTNNIDSADNVRGSTTSLFLSTQTQTRSPEPCKCKKTSKEEERGQHESGPLMEGEVKKEVLSATGVDGLSEEAVPLQEIADILLLLKQRKKEG
ncbi:uncharacterized protein LOC114444518 [Parambassis ranga]|uniref:Uncharacterized protein LOC114444518 n=1 Tax=Parambassis ranga TaxID=210632 RepID=A0A6P7JGQ3_9TELE|nr:uncharacterized protein LOC114444518 [Parambassis ranga]